LALLLAHGNFQTAIAAPAKAVHGKAKGKPVAGKNGKGAKSAKCPAKGGKTAAKTGKGKKPVAKKKVFLEKHVVAVKGNLPNVQSLGGLVVDLDSGQELFARKPDQPRAIASISKLAAMLTVMDNNLDLDGLTTMKKVDSEVARGGAPSRLLENMTLSNRDLLHAALLGSDNRAVSALGRAVGLNSSQFTNAMNHKVAKLELRSTRFREPTGLSPENVSTPREIIQLLRAAMAHPILGPIVRKPEYEAHPVGRPPIKYVSTHRPATRAGMQDLGGKTGYNDAARYCLVIAVRIDNHNYGMALLGTEGKLTRFGDVARVADWIVAHRAKLAAPAVVQGPPLPADIPAMPDASPTPPTAAGDMPAASDKPQRAPMPQPDAQATVVAPVAN
jgi:D-alanyl-D-alanine endopeptidase (penicillin-binding protein 7)